MRYRLWIVALVLAVVGVASLAETPPIGILGGVLLIVPYAAVVGITALAGRDHTGAAVLGVIGVGVMAGLAWYEVSQRTTEGTDPEIGHGFQFCGGCGAHYFVALNVAVLALALVRLFATPKLEP